MTLWGLLWFSKSLNIPILHIFGDSNILIDYVLGWTHIYQPTLQGWLFQVQQLWISYKGPSIEHIGRERNHFVDKLWKRGLHVEQGGLHIEIKMEEHILDARVMPFLG